MANLFKLSLVRELVYKSVYFMTLIHFISETQSGV